MKTLLCINAVDVLFVLIALGIIVGIGTAVAVVLFFIDKNK